MVRCYSYTRFSTPVQASGDSLRRQTERSLAWAKSHGHVLDDSLHLHDAGVSAWKGDNLTSGKLGGFIKACDEGTVERGSILIIESLDRLSRQGVRLALRLFLDILERGITIVTLQPEHIFENDTLDEMSLIIAIVVMGRANEESAMKSYRGKASWESKRKQASIRKITAKCPLWMILSEDKTHFDLISERVDAVKKIFELSCSGLGGMKIVKYLHAHVPPFKKVWSKTSIRRILSDRSVLGEYQPHTGSVKHKNRKPIGEPLLNYYPRIISDDVFYHAQKSLKDNLVQRGRKGNNITNLFTGLVRDTFGGIMAVVSKDRRVLVSYEATRGRGDFVSFPYEFFEIGIMRWLKELRSEDVITHKRDVNDKLAASQGKLDALTDRISKIKRELKSEDDIEPLMAILRELDNDRKMLVKEIATIKEQLASTNDIGSTQDLIHIMDTTEEPSELRQRIKARIRDLISSIVVDIKVIGQSRWALVEITLTSGIKRWVLMMYSKGNPAFWHQSVNSRDDLLPLLKQHGLWCHSPMRGETE